MKLPSKNQNFHEKAKFRRSMHDRMTRSLRIDMDDESLQDEINNPRKMSMAIENTFNNSTVSSQRGTRNKLHRTGSKTSSILKRITRRQTANACSTIGQKDYKNLFQVSNRKSLDSDINPKNKQIKNAALQIDNMDDLPAIDNYVDMSPIMN